MDKFNGMNQFLKEKLRAPTMTAHDAPDGGDKQLADAAAILADEATNDYPYTPPIPVPIMRQMERGPGQRGTASETWLVNPPAALPGLGALVAGGNAEKGSQFPINSIRVDNLTSQWMYWPENGVFIPPFWYGRVFRFTGSLVQRVRFETPTGITALAATSTNVARVMFSEDYWDEQSGASVGGNISSLSTGAPNIGVTIFDDLSGLPAEVQTSADGLAQQAGLIVNSFMFGRNPVGTMDEVRVAMITDNGSLAGHVNVLNALTNAAATGRFNMHNAAANANIAGNSAGNGMASVGLNGWQGTGFDAFRIPNVFKQINNVALGAGSTATVWTPAAGKRPRLMGWVVDGVSGLVDAAITFFETSTTGTFMGDAGYIAGVQPPTPFSYGGFAGPIVSTSSAVIVAFSSTAVTFRGTLWGTEE